MAPNDEVEQFAKGRPFFHGHGTEISDTHLRSPKERGSLSRYPAALPDRVYASPDEKMAWNYAEHGAASDLRRLKPPLREATLSGKAAWGTDPTKTGRYAPRVSQVEMEGRVELDSNWAKSNTPVSEQKAFTADRARIIKTDTIPMGAQTSMLPNPQHGGRYADPHDIAAREPASTPNRDPKWEKVGSPRQRNRGNVPPQRERLFDVSDYDKVIW